MQRPVVGDDDLVQKEVNAPEFRQVRAARGCNTLFLYGCNNFPWGGGDPSRNMSGYKNILSN